MYSWRASEREGGREGEGRRREGGEREGGMEEGKRKNGDFESVDSIFTNFPLQHTLIEMP